eukprot:1146340-Pelagomonas_calceolata.AAC.5
MSQIGSPSLEEARPIWVGPLWIHIYWVVLGDFTPLLVKTRVTKCEAHPPNRLPEPRLASPSARLS